MNLSADEKLALLKMEFPTLSLDSDDDVERYFELRKNGAHQAALQIYNTKLRRKFPNETTRILLLRYYRANDPRYQVLLTQHLHQMADHFAVKVQNALFYLTRDVESLDVSDAYAVIKTIEKIIAMLAPDRDRAPAAAEKFVTYSDKIHFRQELMRKTADLVRQYVSESLDSVEMLRQSVELQRRELAANAERAAVDGRIRAKEQAAAQLRAIQNKKNAETRGQASVSRKSAPQKSIFDLSTITFSPEDLARIEIPSTITRLEDKVLAYSLRFWPVVSDPAFERTVFLYSKKYGTKHFDIYNAIKIGRAQQRRDGDILTSVLSVLATGYFYSVQGDRYLQVMWKRLHAGDAVLPGTTTVSTPVEVDETPRSVEQRKTPSRRVTKKTKQRAKEQRKAVQREVKRLKTKQSVAVQRKVALDTAKTRTVAKSERKPLLVAQVQTTKKRDSVQKLSKARFAEANVADGVTFTCSVADMIKQLSGKSYDVYKDVFLKTVRPAIRKELASCRTTQPRLFDTTQNKAEEAVYSFLEENYNNPFMDWIESRQKRVVADLGFQLSSLDHIIALWYAENK